MKIIELVIICVMVAACIGLFLVFQLFGGWPLAAGFAFSMIYGMLSNIYRVLRDLRER